MRKQSDFNVKIIPLRLICIILLTAFCISSEAQSYKGNEFFYTASIDMNFDNREYDASGKIASETLFGARFSPEIGLRHKSGSSISSIAAGLDIRKDFGDADRSLGALLEDVKIYGSHYRGIGGTAFCITGGVFSRDMMKEEWTEVFFSEKYLWLHPNISGLLISDNWFKGNFELACDWIGEFGSSYSTREQFLVMSAAHHDFNPLLTLGYNAYMMHFACSQETDGVVDNLLAEPWAKIRLLTAPVGLWKELSIKAGAILSAQRDRNLGSGFTKAALGEFTVKARVGSLSLVNRYFLGQSIMSLYNSTDSSGYLYADRLYFNDPLFIMDGFENRSFGSHDSAEIRWEPRLGGKASLEVSARFHFHNNRYSGCQQIVRLIVTL